LNQKFSNFEIIVVNDGSTDNSLRIIEGHTDKRIRIVNQKNAGVSTARNNGGQIARGCFLVFLDADDIWLENHLSELKRAINSYPEHSVFCNNYLIEYSKNKFKSIKFSYLKLVPNAIYKITNYFKNSLNGDIAWTSAVCIKREVFLKNPFDPEIKSVQDTDLWFRLSRNYEFIFNNTQTSIYKKYIDQYSLSKCNDIDNKVRFINKSKSFEIEDQYLKSYLDQNRFSIALEYKLIGQKGKFTKLKKDLDLKNLSLKRAIILNLPSAFLKFLIRFKK